MSLSDTDATDAPARDAPARDTAALTPGPRPAAETTDRDVRLREGEVEWRCRVCGAWSALGLAACARCGMPRSGFGDHPVRQDPAVEPVPAVVASLILPGLGHLLLGAPGSGLGRALPALLWGIGGFSALRAGAGTVAAVLLVGAAVLWAVSAVDVARMAGGRDRQLLEGRRLAVLVGAVTAALVVVSFVPAADRDRSATARDAEATQVAGARFTVVS